MYTSTHHGTAPRKHSRAAPRLFARAETHLLFGVLEKEGGLRDTFTLGTLRDRLRERFAERVCAMVQGPTVQRDEERVLELREVHRACVRGEG